MPSIPCPSCGGAWRYESNMHSDCSPECITHLCVGPRQTVAVDLPKASPLPEKITHSACRHTECDEPLNSYGDEIFCHEDNCANDCYSYENKYKELENEHTFFSNRQLKSLPHSPQLCHHHHHYCSPCIHTRNHTCCNNYSHYPECHRDEALSSSCSSSCDSFSDSESDSTNIFHSRPPSTTKGTDHKAHTSPPARFPPVCM